MICSLQRGMQVIDSPVQSISFVCLLLSSQFFKQYSIGVRNAVHAEFWFRMFSFQRTSAYKLPLPFFRIANV